MDVAPSFAGPLGGNKYRIEIIVLVIAIMVLTVLLVVVVVLKFKPFKSSSDPPAGTSAPPRTPPEQPTQPASQPTSQPASQPRKRKEESQLERAARVERELEARLAQQEADERNAKLNDEFLQQVLQANYTAVGAKNGVPVASVNFAQGLSETEAEEQANAVFEFGRAHGVDILPTSGVTVSFSFVADGMQSNMTDEASKDPKIVEIEDEEGTDSDND